MSDPVARADIEVSYKLEATGYPRPDPKRVTIVMRAGFLTACVGLAVLVWAGLMLRPKHSGDLTTSTFDETYYRAGARNAAGASAHSNTAGAMLGAAAPPAPWLDGDIGAVGLPGNAGHAGRTFAVKGSGADIWGRADSFHYVYQPLNGDGQIVARVASLQNTNQWAKAGVMVRETLAPGSAEVSVAVTPADGIAFLQRPGTGGISSVTFTGGAAAPYWVKLDRSGSDLTGYASADKVAWRHVGSAKVAMAKGVWIGLAVSAKDNTVLNASAFEDVSVTGPGVAPEGPPGDQPLASTPHPEGTGAAIEEAVRP